MENRLTEEYLEWMYQLVCADEYTEGKSYRQLLRSLHGLIFTYTIPMDGNRADDGIELRYRFGYERGYKDAVITNCIDVQPCSVLEMMVALSIRCNEHILWEPETDYQNGYLFWEMMKNLGLSDMTDEVFDPIKVEQIVDIFMDRQYDRNGNGGLFPLKNRNDDLRNVDIWYQMCWYLDENQ